MVAALRTLQDKFKRQAGNERPKIPPIRILMNGQWEGNTTRSEPLERVMSALGYDASSGASEHGLVAFHWSANTMQLTHQNSAIIDGRSEGGAYETDSALPDTAKLLVMTGPLATYRWASSDAPCTSPSCASPASYQGVRDFVFAVKNPDAVHAAQAIFNSDWGGPGPTETNRPVIDPGDTRSLLVWSNGSTGIFLPAPMGTPAVFSQFGGTYPQLPNALSAQGMGFYPVPAGRFRKNLERFGLDSAGTAQGNTRSVIRDMIETAQRSIRIYAQFLSDPAIVDALKKRAEAGVSVSVIQSYANASANPGNLQGLVRAGGAEARLMPSLQQHFRYIRANVILVDAETNETRLYLGSSALSTPSLDYHRELGIHLHGRSIPDSVRQVLLQAFNDDWALTGDEATLTLGGQSVKCPVVHVDKAHSLETASRNLIPTGHGAGCPLPENAKTRLPNSTIDDWLLSMRPGARGPGIEKSTFSDDGPLAGIRSDFTPPFPQGPIRTTTPPPAIIAPLTTE